MKYCYYRSFSSPFLGKSMWPILFPSSTILLSRPPLPEAFQHYFRFTYTYTFLLLPLHHLNILIYSIWEWAGKAIIESQPINITSIEILQVPFHSQLKPNHCDSYLTLIKVVSQQWTEASYPTSLQGSFATLKLHTYICLYLYSICICVVRVDGGVHVFWNCNFYLLNTLRENFQIPISWIHYFSSKLKRGKSDGHICIEQKDSFLLGAKHNFSIISPISGCYYGANVLQIFFLSEASLICIRQECRQWLYKYEIKQICFFLCKTSTIPYTFRLQIIILFFSLKW